MGHIDVVVGGQYGSEGKGAVGARIARDYYGSTDMVVRVAGPNAGHTAYDKAGQKFAFRQLPVASVTSDATVVIAAGSELDLQVLKDEIHEADSLGHQVSSRLIVDSSVTVIDPEHKEAEAAGGLTVDSGNSTGKGIGAARAARAMRKARRLGDLSANEALGLKTFSYPDTAGIIRQRLAQGHNVMIEGTQGYGLGLHGLHYPKCTSSDCRAIDFLAMAGVNPFSHGTTVWLTLRVYPIRIAGNSGYMKDETSWSELDLPEEITTVTKRVRRVGGWDPELAHAAAMANGGADNVKVALTMVDQRFPHIAGRDGRGLQLHPSNEEDRKLLEFIGQVEYDTGECRVAYVGTGPTTGVWR